MVLTLLIVFGAGIYVGYKYPQQVERAVETTKKTFNDLKDKVTKKGS